MKALVAAAPGLFTCPALAAPDTARWHANARTIFEDVVAIPSVPTARSDPAAWPPRRGQGAADGLEPRSFADYVLNADVGGATDGALLRAVGIPVYGVDGTWIVSPDDERAHGKDERVPVKAFNDNLDHWHTLIARLAG